MAGNGGQSEKYLNIVPSLLKLGNTWNLHDGNMCFRDATLLSSIVAQMVKILPAMLETCVRSLGWEDPLEKGWQPTLVFLSGESCGRGSLAGYSPWNCSQTRLTD